MSPSQLDAQLVELVPHILHVAAQQPLMLLSLILHIGLVPMLGAKADGIATRMSLGWVWQ